MTTNEENATCLFSDSSKSTVKAWHCLCGFLWSVKWTKGRQCSQAHYKQPRRPLTCEKKERKENCYFITRILPWRHEVNLICWTVFSFWIWHEILSSTHWHDNPHGRADELLSAHSAKWLSVDGRVRFRSHVGSLPFLENWCIFVSCLWFLCYSCARVQRARPRTPKLCMIGYNH